MTSAATGDEQRTVSVLVVEGSAGGRRILIELLEADRQIAVAGAVADCDAAMRFLDGQRPDVVLIGAEMPATDGFETTRRIMETRPVPIVLAAVAATANDTIFRSLEAGAVACVDYPAGGAGHPADAAARGLQDDAMVRVWNDLGEVRLPLRITDAVRPGVVCSAKGAWFKTSDNGQTVSALAPATKADIGEGACFNDARVEVTAYG